MCEQLTRRQLLKYGAMVAATFPMVGARDWHLSAQAQAGLAVPMHLELVTVTDTYAIITWFTGDPTNPDEFGRPGPVAAPGRVLIGTSPADLREVGVHEATPYHHVEVTGLDPGTTYFFVAESNGIAATPTAFSPLDPDPTNGGVFTTLAPPPGGELMRMAWVNDLHIGESVSGLFIGNDSLPGGGLPPGFPVDPENPYWRTMAMASVAEARARGANLLLANGDLSGSARPESVREARSLLNGFGALGGGAPGADGVRFVRPDDEPAWFAARGNHDRAHRGEEYAECSPVAGDDELRDCFRDTFADGFIEGTTQYAVVAGTREHRVRMVGLDSSHLDTGSGQLPPEQIEFLEAQLDAGDPTIPMFHHIVGDLSTLTGLPPFFGVQDEQAANFRAVIAGRENVAAVYNGHTHRNQRTISTDTGQIPFEGAAVKEYPGGYTMVRLYEGGLMVNFHKAADPEARAWSERSRGEYLNLFPYYTLGGFGDRNWVHHFDLTAGSGQPIPADGDQTGDPRATDDTDTPGTGGGLVGAGVLMATAGALVGLARRE